MGSDIQGDKIITTYKSDPAKKRVVEEAEHGKNTNHYWHYSRHPWPLLAIVAKIESGPTAR